MLEGGSLRCGLSMFVVSVIAIAWSTRSEAQAVAPAQPIEARAEAGAVVARGNADNESFNAKFDVSYERRRWKQSLGLSGVYAADDMGATGQRWDVRGQTDYKFLTQGFSFVAARYEEDRFSGFEYQTSYSAGLGWRFFDDDTTRLIAQIGAGYRRLRTRDSLADDGLTSIPGGIEEDFVQQVTVQFEHAFNANTKVRDELLVELGADNTQVRNDVGLQVRIWKSLALAVGYSVRYNTNPPAGFETTDTLSTLNLVYELD